jgi:uncharacterized repeat protein (TIGR03803 family)
MFSFGGADGVEPLAGVIQDARNLYGTTYGGGVYGYGTVYKLSKTGKLTVLHSFAGGVDGQGPNARLLRDAKGNLYGTTGQGGTSRVGTVFKLTP